MSHKNMDILIEMKIVHYLVDKVDNTLWVDQNDKCRQYLVDNVTILTRILQPFGQVPSIEDGDFKLFESRAIIRYYAAKSASEGGTNLLGETLEERALVEQWMEVEVNNYNPLIYRMVLQLVVLPQEGQVGDMELVQDCKGKLEKVLDVYEERLSKSKYLGGERFTIADLTHLPNTRFLMEEGGMEDLIKRRKNLHKWWVDISSRPSWLKVMDLPK